MDGIGIYIGMLRASVKKTGIQLFIENKMNKKDKNYRLPM
jgi:hypothetical protein